MEKKASDQADYNDIVSHLKIIRTWAEVDRKYGGIMPDCCEHIVTWIDEALELLKEQEQKCGKWERITGMAPPEYHGHRICSICECFAPYDPLHMGREILPKYCPGCGAKMEGENECG